MIPLLCPIHPPVDALDKENDLQPHVSVQLDFIEEKQVCENACDTYRPAPDAPAYSKRHVQKTEHDARDLHKVYWLKTETKTSRDVPRSINVVMSHSAFGVSASIETLVGQVFDSQHQLMVVETKGSMATNCVGGRHHK